MKYRLKKQSDFDKLFKKGKRVILKSLTFIYSPAEDFKIGYSVSKKHGKAFMRNRIKRLLRESARENLKNHTDLKFHIVILPKIKENYFKDEFSKDIAFALKKENIL